MKKLKIFEDGSFIGYDSGRFDKYCVYLVKDLNKKAPKDIEYFESLKILSKKYGSKKIYQDFIRIYDKTSNMVENSVLNDLIDNIANSYDEDDSLEINKVFSTIYLGMIAEEKKENTKLGKKIKRLGIHYLLIDNKSVSISANFMKGMNYQEIESLCKERGF